MPATCESGINFIQDVASATVHEFSVTIFVLQAVYDWWQYRLCDVFIELVKPVMQRKDQDAGATDEKAAFRDTLWTCLDTGLRYSCVG